MDFLNIQDGGWLVFLQPHTQALFSTLLAGERDPGKCWSRGSQILAATRISITRKGRIRTLFG